MQNHLNKELVNKNSAFRQFQNENASQKLTQYFQQNKNNTSNREFGKDLTNINNIIQNQCGQQENKNNVN